MSALPSTADRSAGGGVPLLAPLEPAEVRLTDPDLLRRQQLNREYLLSLDTERLLHNFRVNAGLPSTATPLGGWEAPTCGLRGHFVGHYLSACAHGYATTADAALRSRPELLVRGLAECQARVGTGYVSAFPESDLDAIETRFEGAWASYYTLHKILAGLLDVHRHCKDAPALAVATKLADYIARRIARLTPEQLEGMCRTDKPNPTNEFGGMAEVLRDLAEATGNGAYARLAGAFERDWFLAPLMRREDRLAGLHANTHIPIAIGAARRYELPGDERSRDAVAYFWERTAQQRSYVNGGSSGPRPDGREKSTGAEHWPEASKLARSLTSKINESCVTHNMRRLTEVLFRWTGDIAYADFDERAWFNSVLTMQHPGRMGGYLYHHPLSPGSCKEFGTAQDTFWCCYGTSVEAFARLAQGIYYRGDGGLWINRLTASEARLPEHGLLLEQHTRFPSEGTSRLVFRCERPVTLALHVRIPAWADAPTAALNGETLATRHGAYLRVEREWRDGDTLNVRLPMRIHTESLPDDPDTFAFLYGPLVLAARSDADLRLPAASIADAGAAVRRMPTSELAFQTTLANGRSVELVPLHHIVDEAYGVYFTLHY